MGIVIYVALSIAVLFYLFNAWVKPVVVRLFHKTHQLGPDKEVSLLERWSRADWRYNTWIDRIGSLLVAALFFYGWVYILSH